MTYGVLSPLQMRVLERGSIAARKARDGWQWFIDGRSVTTTIRSLLRQELMTLKERDGEALVEITPRGEARLERAIAWLRKSEAA